MGKSSRQPAKPKQPDARHVNQRGQEWQAVKLTGKRAQRGNLRGGAPCWTYEVVWQVQMAHCGGGYGPLMHAINNHMEREVSLKHL